MSFGRAPNNSPTDTAKPNTKYGNFGDPKYGGEYTSKECSDRI
jgi:hypothetical protein